MGKPRQAKPKTKGDEPMQAYDRGGKLGPKWIKSMGSEKGSDQLRP